MRLRHYLAALCLLQPIICHAAPVHKWGVFEASITSSQQPVEPGQHVNVQFELTGPEGNRHIQPGFWNGGRTWTVRFSPSVVGGWKWRSLCETDASLNNEFGAFECVPYQGDNPLYRHGPIRVSHDGHYLTHTDGTPFFWLVDTAWNGALKSTEKDWGRFLEDRVEKSFTGIQYVVTQWRTAYANTEGLKAYEGYEEIRINPEFFKRIDERTQAVNDKGLLAVPVLLWTLGSREHNPGQLPEDQAILLARYMIARLGAYHVSWFLPGDGNYFGDNVERWKRIGRAVFDKPGHATATLHPQGMQWPWDAFLGEKWISYLGYQSGHGDDGRTLEWIYNGPPAQKWSLPPIRPVINLEPPYEDHIAYQSKQRHTAYTVRRATYWSLLNAPTAGASYGAHGVWSWESRPNTPQEHGGTGVAKPWQEAMALPGSTSMKHMADLFTSIDWWRLRPDDAFVSTNEEQAGSPELTHVIYTRESNGKSTLYVNADRAAQRTIAGDLGNWDPNFRLALANELSNDRPWLGNLYHVAVYDNAMTANGVKSRFAAGRRGKADNPIVLYNFTEGGGNLIKDNSGRGVPLNLKIDKTQGVRWIKGGGLEINKPVLIASLSPTSKIKDAVARTRQMTIEAWIKPANLTQAGPARILTVSKDTGQRNFTLGQMASGYEVRFRTTKTSTNGEPAVGTAAPGEDHRAQHVSASLSSNGDLAVIYCPVGASIAVKTDRLKKDLKARWIDPSSGQRRDARSKDGRHFKTPNDSDWVLLFQ